MRRQVVLPQPDGPSSEINSPAAIRMSMSPIGRNHVAKFLGDIAEFDDRVFHGFVRRWRKPPLIQ